MSIITDEMDRLKGIAMKKFIELASSDSGYNKSTMFFELGYAYGMDDARRMQETIKRLAEEAVSDERN